MRLQSCQSAPSLPAAVFAALTTLAVRKVFVNKPCIAYLLAQSHHRIFIVRLDSQGFAADQTPFCLFLYCTEGLQMSSAILAVSDLSAESCCSGCTCPKTFCLDRWCLAVAPTGRRDSVQYGRQRRKHARCFCFEAKEATEAGM